MKKERHSKRRRVGNNDPYPDLVVSVSSSRGRAPVVDQPVRADDHVPSAQDISKELGKVDNISSKVNALRALKQLQEWLIKEKIESSVVLENFHCYGGIARVFDFLETNMNDMDCVVGTVAFIADFLSFRWNAKEQKKNLAIEMAKMIVRRNGVELLLRANHEYAVGHRTSSAKKHIWVALGRTINGEETRGIIGKKKKMSILNDAIDCIFRLEEIGSQDNNVWTVDVLQVVLYAMANTIKDASLVKEDLKHTDVVSVCLKVLKRDADWNRNEDVVTYTLGILTICTKQKTIVRRKEFEQLLPMLMNCIRCFRENSQIRSFVLALLEGACDKVHKETMEKAGVLEAISTLIKPEGLSEEIKEKARGIMRKILN